MTSQPQYMTALATANVVRKARSALRQQVHGARNFEASCAELAGILEDGAPTCMASMRIEEALRWVRTHGHVTARFINDTLDVVGCSEFRPVGELTVRQRSILVNVLRAYSAERRAA